MSLINTEIKPFKATAYKAGKFVDVSEASVKGKWCRVLLLSGRLHLRLPDRTRGPRRPSGRVRQGIGVEVYGVSTDTHFSHKAWHDSVERDRQDHVRLDRRPDGQRCRAISTSTPRRRVSPTAAPSSSIRSGVDPDRSRSPPRASGRNAAELVRKIKAANVLARAPRSGVPGQVGKKAARPSRAFDRSGWQDLVAFCESASRCPRYGLSQTAGPGGGLYPPPPPGPSLSLNASFPRR
jgi:peroxiredoxin (alkyl hydroperoxide reductase subunit C)